MARSNLKSTTIRDFSGGWNVSDSDLNLNSRYQPISENVTRGVDGSLVIRQGTILHADFKNGKQGKIHGNIKIKTVKDKAVLNVTLPTHELIHGDHVTIQNVNQLVAGIPTNEINGTYSIKQLSDDEVECYIRVKANASVVVDIPHVNVILDNHTLAGNIIHTQYFNRRLIVFTSIGEVGTIDNSGNLERIWGTNTAEKLQAGLVPTRRCEHWSSVTFKSTMIACNGYNRDKPIQIFEDFHVEFLVDKATSSNAAVPRADYVVALQGYLCFIRTEFGNPFIEMSARGTDGTFTRDPNPSDSCEVDLSMVTSSVEPVLLGAVPIRDKLYAAFYDKGVIGTLGVYGKGGSHIPNFSDTINENGTISHRTMVSLGNDVFMCDYAGVPSVSISQQSGIYVPARLSELISPVLQAHLANLSEDTLRIKAFSVFNKTDRTYMLFLPIYDEVTNKLPNDPFELNNDMCKSNLATVHFPSHKLFENSYVRVVGSDSIGGATSTEINSVHKVVSIIDEDNFVIQFDNAPNNTNITSGGGNNVQITPINNETFVYAFEYNRSFKIKRWTLYRGWNFDCTCLSQRGKVYLCKGLKVYRMGDNEKNIHADLVNDYDESSWQNDKSYYKGTRVKDTDALVYICKTKNVPSSENSFADYRKKNPEVWEEYKGIPIRWAVETPWSDMNQRGHVKNIQYINIDSKGSDKFTVSCFTNQIRNSPTTHILAPVRSMQFRGGDSKGWGLNTQSGWGSGRRTREEKVWPFFVRGKLIRWRYEGETTGMLKIISHTMYYKTGNIR